MAQTTGKGETSPKKRDTEVHSDEEEGTAHLKLGQAQYTDEDINEELDMANEVLQGLMEKEMQDTASEFKRIIDVSYFLYSEMKKLKKTNEELAPKVVDANEKLVMSLQITASSQETINRLKAALEDSWREVDATRKREQDYQEEILELQGKCKNFEQKNVAEDDDADLGPLAKHKGVILRERDRLSGEVKELEKRLQVQRFYGETLEQMCQKTEEANAKLRNALEDSELSENRSERKIQMLLKNIEELKDTNKFLLRKCDGYEKQIDEQLASLKEKSKEIEKLRYNVEKTSSDFISFKKKFMQLKKSYNSCLQDRKLLAETIQRLIRDNKAKDEEITQKTKIYKKIQNDFENLSLKVFKLEKTNLTLHADMIKFKNQVNTRERDITSQKREMEDIRRLKEIVAHERDSLRSELIKANNTIADLRHLNMMRNATIDSLNMDIRKHQVKMEETKRIIVRVERERDEQIQETELLNDKIDGLNEQIQLKTDQIGELQRQLQEKHANYIKLQKLLETTNSERVMLQRSLQSCSEERSNLKQLQSVTAHQMAQLTEEISNNQNTINQLHLHIDKILKEKQEVITELRSTKKLLSSTRQELRDMKAKNEKLQKTLSDDELRFMQLEHTLEETRKEKNLIGLQMVRRNDEISLLKERLDIVQTAVDRGVVQYNQRIEDIRLLKLEITQLHTQRDVLRRGVAYTVRLRRELIRLQRNLDQEQIECRALKEDLRVPVNVHRWRILRGTDPERYALVQKARILQKRLLIRFVEGQVREKALQNCHQLYVSLKVFMEKLPSYKVKEDFVTAQRGLRARDKKLKALSAELAAKEIEVKTRDCTIAELTANLIIVKKELFTEKKLVSKLLAKQPIPLPPGKCCTA